MAKKTVRSELYGIRVTPLDRARIEFLAKVAEKSPTTFAAQILSEAARQKIYEMSSPVSPEGDGAALDDARAI